MNRNIQRSLSLLLSLLLLLTAALPAVAAGDSADPNVFLSRAADWNEDWTDPDTTVTFDPAAGTLTIDDHGSSVPIADAAMFYAWIKGIAPGVKTVVVKKDSELENFSMNEEGDAEYSAVFYKAFSYLENLESFVVEKGNRFFKALDGVLYEKRAFRLVHYPAGKTDKTYKVDDACLYDFMPYAFCNTKYLERLELPYAHLYGTSSFYFGEYALSAVDLDTGAERQSSIKEIVYYGEIDDFKDIAGLYEGNNVVRQAEIVCKETNSFRDMLTYIRLNFVMRLLTMLDMVFQYGL